MPRDSNGNYTLPAGNPVVTGTVIETTWANPTMGDIASEMTNSLDRQGRGGMLAPFRFADGSVGSPSLTFTSEPTLGIFRAAVTDLRAVVGGTARMRWTAAGVDIWNGSAWVAMAGAPDLSVYLLKSTLPNVVAVSNVSSAELTHVVGVTSAIQTQLNAKAADADVVKLTGNQTVAGTKTFTSNVIINRAETDAYLSMFAGGAVRGHVYAANTNEIGFLNNGGAWSFRVNASGTASVIENLELGHDTDTTLSRIAAGRVAIEGGEIAKLNGAQPFTAVQQISLASVPALLLHETGVAADNRLCYLRQSSSVFQVVFFNDAFTEASAPFSATRNGGRTISARLNANDGANDTVQLASQSHSEAPHTTGAEVRHADGSLYDVGMNVVPRFTSASGALTFAQTHCGKMMVKFGADNATWTTPGTSDTTIPAGAMFTIQNQGPGVLTIAGGSGVTIYKWLGAGASTTGNATLAAGAVATLYKDINAAWEIWGNGQVS